MPANAQTGVWAGPLAKQDCVATRSQRRLGAPRVREASEGRSPNGSTRLRRLHRQEIYDRVQEEKASQKLR
jgi:hypothetical protein